MGCYLGRGHCFNILFWNNYGDVEILPSVLREKMSRIGAVIYLRRSRSDLSDLVGWARELGQCLRRTPGWRDLTIDFVYEDDGDNIDSVTWEVAEKQVLLPLQYFRGFRSVIFGSMVDVALGKTMAERMMSSAPIADSECMYHSAKQYAEIFQV